MTKKTVILLAIIAMAVNLGLKAQKTHTDYDFTLRNIDSLSFLHEDVADLNFPDSHAAEAALYSKLDHLLQTGKGRVNILHVGDSHVQASPLASEIRNNLSDARELTTGKQWGGADRGILFPYEVMKTAGPEDYKVTSTGSWSRYSCLNDENGANLGLAGAAVTTKDHRASITITLKDSRWSFTQLRVLGEPSNDDVYPIIIAAGDTLEPIFPDDDIGYIFNMRSATTSFTIAFRGLTDGSRFTLRGFIPHSNRSGITYTSVGINGTTVSSWLKCGRFQDELSVLSPDLVIFGLGTNDAYKDESRFSTEQFKDNYRKLIDEVKSVNSRCTFIFITNSDCWYNRHSNPNGSRAEQAFLELAREVNGGVFNLYQVMGGSGSCNQWYSKGYMNNDHVHFKPKGYQLIGDLLSNAIINDFSLYNGRTK